MFYYSVNLAVLTFVLLLTKEKGCTGSRIISSPRHLYVLDGSQGTVRCQNTSDDGETFYSYISNAVWYRYYNNGTNVTIDSAGPINSVKHTLNFNPLLDEDQGFYLCCTQSGQCSEILTTVTISTPPNITAVSSDYTAKVGSQVTIVCSIFNQGVPVAQFRWIRDGIELVGGNVAISQSDMTLTLPNTTIDDSGNYTCSATSERSYRSDHVMLIVQKSETIISNGSYNETSSGEVYLLVTFLESLCQTIKGSLSEFLSRHLREYYYGYSVMITVKHSECINRSTALFKLNVTGPGANETLQQLLNDLKFNTQGLNIGIGVIRVCEQNCTGSNVAGDSTDINDDDDDDDDDAERNNNISQLIVIGLLGIIALFSVIIVICCLVVIYTRCQRRKKSATIGKPMHKCYIVPNETRNPAYDTLQFHGDDHHNRLHSSHPQAVNYLAISSGYVEPDSINSNITTHFPTKPRTANVETTKHKPVVMSTSGGTGIVRVGTLQAVIHSTYNPDDLDDLKIVPSLTHESYVDVVKQSE